MCFEALLTTFTDTGACQLEYLYIQPKLHYDMMTSYLPRGNKHEACSHKLLVFVGTSNNLINKNIFVIQIVFLFH